MCRYHWTTDSWGSAFPPANVDDICNAANALIDAAAERGGEVAAEVISERLWESWICRGNMPRALRVYSVYTEDMESVGVYTRKREAIAAARKYAREHEERVYVLHPGGDLYLSDAWYT